MNLSWLATEAKTIHAIFANSFYIFVSSLLLLGIILDFFKLPLGGSPQVGTLVTRAVIACIILAAMPEIMNMMSDVTDALSKQIGDLNNLKVVLHKMGDKLNELKFSWVSVKDSIILIISFLTFFILYITVYLADAIYLYTWMMLYIFSPILIALFVLPATAGATKALFRSLLEVCGWKIMWSTLATLLWSFALSEINKPGYNINFLTAILLNLMLVFSIVITPIITRALVGGGLAQVAGSMGATILGAAGMSAPSLAKYATGTIKRTISHGKSIATSVLTGGPKQADLASPKRPLK